MGIFETPGDWEYYDDMAQDKLDKLWRGLVEGEGKRYKWVDWTNM